MAIAEQIKTDLQGAMRAGEKERVGALRLRALRAAEGRQGGRATTSWPCCAASASAGSRPPRAYRDAGREDLADGEEAEGELIGGYLPAELSDEELRAIVEQAVRDSGAQSAKDMGAAMKQRDGRRRRPRRRQARLGARARGAAGMRTQIELSNEVAAELAGSQDAVLRALEAHLDCKVFLRGNLLTLRRRGERDATPASASCASSPT